MKQNRLYGDLNVAVGLARLASKEICEIYYGSMEITDKEDGTPVTNADLRANEIIVDGLQRSFPHDGIVSEELGNVNGGRTWYIDPIDGTRGFTYHNDQFAVHIGLEENGQPVLGVVYKPTTDEFYSAIKGEGAFRTHPNGTKIQLKNVRQDLALDEMILVGSKRLLMSEPNRSIVDKLNPKYFQVNGSEGLRIMHIANGSADYHITRDDELGSWDLCAPQAIADEVGLYTMFADGRKPEYTGQRRMGGLVVIGRSQGIAEEISQVIMDVQRNYDG